jgi:hypothetical protein
VLNHKKKHVTYNSLWEIVQITLLNSTSMVIMLKAHHKLNS